MANLLQETLGRIHQSGLSVEDIVYIGSDTGQSDEPYYSCTWEQFAKLANKEYDSGYGSPEVATDLVIIFKNGTWLSRGEYDGSEWWDYNEVPKIPTVTLPIKKLIGGMWDKLSDINQNSRSKKGR